MNKEEKSDSILLIEEIRLLRTEIKEHRELITELLTNPERPKPQKVSIMNWLVPILLIGGVLVGFVLLVIFGRK